MKSQNRIDLKYLFFFAFDDLKRENSFHCTPKRGNFSIRLERLMQNNLRKYSSLRHCSPFNKLMNNTRRFRQGGLRFSRLTAHGDGYNI